MKVCIYGAASAKVDKKYIEDCEELGRMLGARGHSMVFGAGSSGLMGATARGFKAAGAHIKGVIPRFFEENGYESIFYEADELVFTETMAERKSIMEDSCDAFVVVPGGIGTFEEFFQILTLKQLGRHKKAIAVYNSNGYYDWLDKMLAAIMKKGFVNEECAKLYKTLGAREEVIEYIENYSSDDIEWSMLKKT